ncbi:hypothetical protein TNCV_460391 [Trichonephila clavipes]|nr:hypothetical protein TNCV_460391 [Trichonephila clavipes]
MIQIMMRTLPQGEAHAVRRHSFLLRLPLRYFNKIVSKPLNDRGHRVARCRVVGPSPGVTKDPPSREIDTH